MEVLWLVEFFKLIVNGFCFCNIGLNGQELLISFGDKIFEFLFDLQLRQSLLKSSCLVFNKLGQVIRDFLICVKGKYIFG